MTTPIILPISGTVDPALLSGLVMLATNLTHAGEASETAGDKAKESGSSWDAAQEKVTKAADSYNEISDAIGRAIGVIGAVITRVTELATEQGRLDAMSARLGLDFDQAAGAAGRFADETEAMGVAGRFAAADIRLTQTELDAMMRVAGAASETLGTDTAGAVQQLQEALIRGREGGLQRFGQGLADVAGESHTVQERLAALVVQAGHTAQATDTATDRMNRFKDSLEDAQRVAASAFVNETIRIQAFGTAANDASGEVDDLKNNMQALGETGAYVLNQVANLAGVVVGSVAVVIASITTPLRQIAAVAANPTNAAAALRGVQENNNEINGFVADRIRGLMNGGQALDERTTADAAASGTTADQRASDRAARTGAAATPGNGWGGSAGIAAAPTAAPAAGGGSPRTSVFATRAQLAANARASEAEAMAQEGREKAAESAALQRRIARGHAGAQTLQAAEEARRASHIAYEEKRNREEIIFQEMMAAGRAEAANDNAARFAQQAPARAESARLEEEYRSTQEVLRTKRDLDAQLAAHESYTGRLAELNSERVHGAQRAAEFTNSAFDSMGKAIGTHVQALIDGRESVGVALQGMLSDTLISIGKEAVIQGGMEIAKGVAALAGVVTAPLAPGHFAAGAAFLAVGAAAGVAGAALAPSSGAGAGASSAGNGGAGRQVGDRPAGGGESVSPVVINYYAPVIGGREATDSELGTRLDRFDDAARQRLRRAA